MWIIIDLDSGALDGWYSSRKLVDGVAAMYSAEGMRVVVAMKDDGECSGDETVICDEAWMANRVRDRVPCPA